MAVYQLPLRHPVPVARQLSTLSELAPGRLILGVGIGGEDRRVVARFGDGWLGIWNSAKRFAAVVAMVDELAGAAGRHGVAWRHGMQVWCGLGWSREEARPLTLPRSSPRTPRPAAAAST